MADANIYIHINKQSDWAFADVVQNAVEEAWTHIEEHLGYKGVDCSYSVAEKETEPELAGQNKNDYWSQWGDYMWNNNIDSRGCHLLVSTDFDGGLADTGDGIFGTPNAFGNSAKAVVGDTTYPHGDRVQNIAIQEVLHPFLDASQFGSELGPDGDEHSLGCVPYHNNVTPMATTYVDDYADVGDCDSNYIQKGYSKEPSACTMEAMYKTYQHKF